MRCRSPRPRPPPSAAGSASVSSSSTPRTLPTCSTRLDWPDQGLSAEFRPYPAGAGKLAGFAYTIRGQMTPYEGTGDPAKMTACQAVGPEEVSIWSGDGEGICYFGELIALGMKERGCVGALIDGGIRDVRWIGRHGFPVFARYCTAVQSIGRWRVTGCQEAVYLRGATSERVIVGPATLCWPTRTAPSLFPRSTSPPCWRPPRSSRKRSPHPLRNRTRHDTPAGAPKIRTRLGINAWPAVQRPGKPTDNAQAK